VNSKNSTNDKPYGEIKKWIRLEDKPSYVRVVTIKVKSHTRLVPDDMGGYKIIKVKGYVRKK